MLFFWDSENKMDFPQNIFVIVVYADFRKLKHHKCM